MVRADAPSSPPLAAPFSAEKACGGEIIPTDRRWVFIAGPTRAVLPLLIPACLR
jgi:hypothetical protein